MRWLVVLGAVAFLTVVGRAPHAALKNVNCKPGTVFLTPESPVATLDGVVLLPETGTQFTTDSGLSFSVDHALVEPLDAGVLASGCGTSFSGLLALTANDPFGDGGTVTVQVEVAP